MNEARQRSRRFGRATGAGTRSAADYSITATISVVPDPLKLWRSLRFERETLNCRDFQGTTVMNYTEAEVPYTRIHEFKHYHSEGRGKVKVEGEQREVHLWGFDADKTIIMREYSKTWEQGDEPYYPINNPESAALLARYQEEVKKFNHRSTPTPSTYTSLLIGGRLGGYKYYDMDQAMATALMLPIGE